MTSESELIRFGKRVRELRAAKGFSQEAFADQCGLDRTYMGGIERGKRNVAPQYQPNRPRLECLAFGVDGRSVTPTTRRASECRMPICPPVSG